MKLQNVEEIFEKYSNIKFRENPSSGRRVVPCGRTDRRTDRQRDVTKLIVRFRNFANGPGTTCIILSCCGESEANKRGWCVFRI
jgi:hypothetical protein